MRIERAITLRDEAYRRLTSLYLSDAPIFGMDSISLNAASRDIYAGINQAPQWVHQYLQGAEKVLRDMLYRHHLEYGAIGPKGEFLSTHRESPDYYQKHGYDPSEYSDSGRFRARGHYWTESRKPFFLAQD